MLNKYYIYMLKISQKQATSIEKQYIINNNKINKNL